MAKVEDLIQNIPDPILRDQIAREVAKLKASKKFGLVFEEHIPETVQLPSLPVRPGLRVVKRAGKNSEIYRVIAPTSGDSFIIAREGETTQEEIPARELVVIKRFGEPIYPILTPIDRITRAPNKPYHTVINGDNFHALQLLLYAYTGQVDVIYIDPPYNTGSRDWKYNNDYVDKKDQFRHSKWLAMIKKRLILAKKLLKPDGVLIITIDDQEASALGLLVDEVFQEKDRTTIVIKYNPAGTARNGFSRCHEYAFYLLNPGQEIEKKPAPADIRDRNLRRNGNNSNRLDSPSMFYPIYIDKETLSITTVGDVPSNDFHPGAQNIDKGDSIELWPIDNKGREKNWYYSRARVIQKGNDELEVRVVKGVYHLYFHTDNNQEQKYQTVWTGSEYDAGAYGSTLVKNITGKEFPYPKSLYAVRDCLAAIVKNNKNAIILDFFAGSGTTLHATLLLNLADEGDQRCILVTNNEVGEQEAKLLNSQGFFPGDALFEQQGICNLITWPRVKNAITGKLEDGTDIQGNYLDGYEIKNGFYENAEYFHLNFLDPDEVAYGEKFEEILPILWLISGTLGEREIDHGQGKWFISQNSPYAVLINETAFSEFKRAICDRPDLRYVFLVTNSEVAYREMIADLPPSVKTKMLYKSYLDNFRINTEKNL